MGNYYGSAAQDAENQSVHSSGVTKGYGPRRPGPHLDVDDHGVFVLIERGKSRDVIPEYDGDELRIGCTTVSRKALEEIIRLVEAEK